MKISKNNFFSVPSSGVKGLIIILLGITCSVYAQRNVTNANDSNTPLHLLKPDYPVPYGIVKADDVKGVLDRIHGYLNNVTPPAFVNSKTGEVLTDLSKIDENTALQKGDFRLVSYEWGVAYGGMLLASQEVGGLRIPNMNLPKNSPRILWIC